MRAQPPPLVPIPCQGMSVTPHGPVLSHYLKSILDIRFHSWCCTACGFGLTYHDTHPCSCVRSSWAALKPSELHSALSSSTLDHVISHQPKKTKEAPSFQALLDLAPAYLPTYLMLLSAWYTQ